MGVERVDFCTNATNACSCLRGSSEHCFAIYVVSGHVFASFWGQGGYTRHTVGDEVGLSGPECPTEAKGLVSSAVDKRQGNHERGAATRSFFHLDGAFVAPDNRVHNGKARANKCFNWHYLTT